MVDIKKLLEQVRTEREIKEREAKMTKKSPHPSNTFKVGSEGWLKAKRKELKEKRQLEDKELEDAINRSLTQARYYQKNRRRLNHARIKALRKPKPTFRRARDRAARRGQTWHLTYEEWKDIWDSAPMVWNPDKAIKQTAWSMRGGNYLKNTQMVRIDPEGPWTKENTRIHIPVSLEE